MKVRQKFPFVMDWNFLRMLVSFKIAFLRRKIRLFEKKSGRLNFVVRFPFLERKPVFFILKYCFIALFL